jgi:hypothetical protein
MKELREDRFELMDIINVQQSPHSADGDGIADDSGAFISAAVSSANKIVYVPPGTYRLSNNVTFGATVEVWFSKSVILSVDADKTLTILGTLHTPFVPTNSGAGTFTYSGAARPAAMSDAGLGDLKADGTVPLTADWNAGSYDIEANSVLDSANVKHSAYGAHGNGTDDDRDHINTAQTNAGGTAWAFNPPDMGWVKTNLLAWVLNGLIIYLPSDDAGQNTVLDSSGNVNTETLVGSVGWVAGKRNHALDFDATAGSYVTVASNAGLTTQKSRTVSFWLKSAHSTGTVFPVCFINTWIGLWIETTTPRFILNGQNYKNWVSVATKLDNNWHHWVITILGTGASEALVAADIANAHLYIDNVEITAGAEAHTDALNAWGVLRLGGYGGADVIDGSLDEFMMWNRVLTTGERTALYNLNIYEAVVSSLMALWLGFEF